MQNGRKAFSIAAAVAGLLMAFAANATSTPVPARAGEATTAAPMQLALEVRRSKARQDPCKNVRFTSKQRAACNAELYRRTKPAVVQYDPCTAARNSGSTIYGCPQKKEAAPTRSRDTPPVRNSDTPPPRR